MKRSSRLSVSAVWLLCLTFLLAGCGPAATPTPPAPASNAGSGSPAAPSAPVKFKIAQTASSLAFASIYVANTAGYFKEAGVEAELVIVAGTKAAAAVLNGDTQVYAGDLAKIFALAEEKKDDLMLVQLPNNAVTLDLVFSNAYIQKRGLTAQSSLEDRLRAMKGSVLGTLDVGGAPHLLMSYLMRKVALNPEKDFEVMATGTTPAALAALKKGSIDGYMLSAPTSIQAEADQAGKIVVKYVDVPEFRDTPSLGIAVRTDFAKQHPAAVKGMVQAIAKAHTLLAENPTEAAKFLQTSFPNMKPDLLEVSVKALSPAFGNKGRLSDAALRKSAKLLKESGFLASEVLLKEGVHWTNEYNQ